MNFKFKLPKIKMTHKLKLFIFISIEMIAIITIFLLILFAGKKRYTVTFDLNGGELLSGSLVQEVTRGQSATPPVTTKEGCFLLTWSDTYTQVTRDVYAKAIWEYKTTAGIEYEILENSNYCLIKSCYKEISGPVYIGAYYNNLKVLGIKEGAFKDCDRITNIYLLDGMYSIGENAFEGCTSLESIEIPATVESIGYGAFRNCTNLKSINIPASVQKIGVSAFEGCASLESVVINECAKPMILSDNSFKDCTSLTSVTFEDHVIEEEIDKKDKDKDDKDIISDDEEIITEEKNNSVIIGNNVFENCTSLTNVIMPERIKEIGMNAFFNCTDLVEVTLSTKLEKIGANAFSGCEKLTEITIPLSVIKIGNAAFTTDLTINVYFKENEIPQNFDEHWYEGNPTIVYDYQSVLDSQTPEENPE